MTAPPGMSQTTFDGRWKTGPAAVSGAQTVTRPTGAARPSRGAAAVGGDGTSTAPGKPAARVATSPGSVLE